MKKILVFTTSLNLGGITSFLVNIVNKLAEEYEVTLAYTKDSDSKLSLISKNVKQISYKRPPRFKIFMHMIKRGWLKHALKIKFRNHKRIAPMKSNQRLAFTEAQETVLPEILLENFDIAISSAEFYCNNVVAMKINAARKIAWIHPDYSSLNTDVTFDRKTLDKFDKIAVVSKSNIESLCFKIPEYKNKIVYVPNTLDINRIYESAKHKPAEYENIADDHIIVTVCRLDNSSKRLDRAVEICKALKERGDRFKWFVVGDGPDREFILDKVKKAKVEDCMCILGKRLNPYPYMAFADLFVLTSQYEGRPIAIDEALTLTCPVIVTKYASAEEQINKSEGIIIENSDVNFVRDFLEKLDWKLLSGFKDNLKINNHYALLYSEFAIGIKEALGDK